MSNPREDRGSDKRRPIGDSGIVPEAKLPKTAAADAAPYYPKLIVEDDNAVSAPRSDREHNKYGPCDDEHWSFTHWKKAKKREEAAKMTDEERYVHFVVLPVPS